MIYTVKAGDSLSKIAAANGISDWKTIWKANSSISNPNLIRPGQQINIPEPGEKPAEAPPPGSLEKTLPPETGSGLPETPMEKALPAQTLTEQSSPLTNLRLALRDIAEKTYKKNLGDQTEEMFGQLGTLGIKPENIRGTSVQQIIGTLQENTSNPIEKSFATMGEQLDSIQKEQEQKKLDARTNLNAIQNMIIESNKGWDTIPDALKQDILKLEKDSGLPTGTLEAFTRAKPKAKLMATNSGYDSAGREIISFVYEDEDGNPGVVKTVKTGGVRPPSGGGGNPTTSVKPISEATRNKFFLPSTTTQGEFNTINDAIKSFVTGNGGVNNNNRYDLWDGAVKGLQAMGVNPSAYDALMWDYFHPEGLAGFKTHRLGQAEKKSGKVNLDAAAIANIMNQPD